MKVLIINNFNEKLLVGGVENYLLELLNYNKSLDSDIEFYWYGKNTKKTKWIQKIYNYSTTSEIKKIIEEFCPDIIHCYSIGAPVTPHFLKYANSKNIPIVFSFRDYYYVCPKNYMLNGDGSVIEYHNNAFDCIQNHIPKKNIFHDTLLYLKQNYHQKLIKKYCHHFLTPSYRLTKTISNHLNLKGETLANPVLLQNDENLELSEEFILYVGRADQEKGILTLLKAIKNFPNEKLLIAGNGSQLNELKEFADQNFLNNIEFLGDKTRSELKQLYAKAKFVVIPSEFLESYGNVVLESFSFKKTIIASNLIGLKNEIETNNCGILFSYGNVDELTKAINKLLVDNEFRCLLAKNGYEFSRKNDFKNHYKNLIQIYNSLLKS